jgi:general secretion pathway protein D
MNSILRSTTLFSLLNGIGVGMLSLALMLPTPSVMAAAGIADTGAMVTPNYKDAEIGNVIEAVSQVTGRNFIVDPRVKAQVTMISATPLTAAAFYEAFLGILQVHGFVVVPAGKVYKIIPDANARQLPASDLPDDVNPNSDELVTQVVQLRNVSASQLVPILRPLMPQQAHLAAYPAANMLILSDHASNVARLIHILDRIDRTGDENIEVIRLEHASAAEIARVVNQLTANTGPEQSAAKMIADERTNSILISGERNQRLRLRTLVAHLDTPSDRGGNTKVRYLRYADADKLASKLKDQANQIASATNAGGNGNATGGSTSGNEQKITIWADVPTNALVVTAPPKMMNQLMNIVDQLDIRRLEVQIEAIIVEVTGEKTAQLGVNWLMETAGSGVPAGGFVSPLDSSGNSIVSLASAAYAAQSNPAAAAGAASAFPNGLTLGGARIGSAGTNFAAVVNALNGNANTNIISTPSITTLDNQEAQIKVTTEVPFLTGSYSNASSTASATSSGASNYVAPFQTIQRQEVGTILKITPQITDDKTILLKIDQEVSSLIKSSIATVDVQTSKRTVSTRVLANDGEIIVLGGLISDSVTQSEQRVPLLSSIPGIGQLFKTANSNKTKTNLMVFVRPKILINPEQMAQETAAKYNAIRALQSGQSAKVLLQSKESQAQLPPLESLKPAVNTINAETPKAEASRKAREADTTESGSAHPPMTQPDSPHEPK